MWKIAQISPAKTQLRGGFSPNGNSLQQNENSKMLYSVLIILAVGLIAPALALFGMALTPGKIIWILFSVGIVLLGILFLTERRLFRAGKGKSALGEGGWRQGATERWSPEKTKAPAPHTVITTGLSTASSQASSDPPSE